MQLQSNFKQIMNSITDNLFFPLLRVEIKGVILENKILLHILN